VAAAIEAAADGGQKVWVEVSKMKQRQVIILAAVGAAVLLTALGVGFYIREARQKSEAGDETGAESGGKQSGGSLIPGGVGRENLRNLSEQERARIVEERKKIAQRQANMSEEEKEKFRQQVRERFNVRRGGASERLPALSEEERARLREKWANMSEQEREQLRNKMREEFGAARREPNAVQQEPNVVGQEPNVIRQEKK